MPIIGDPLTLVAGVLRELLPTFHRHRHAGKAGAIWCWLPSPALDGLSRHPPALYSGDAPHHHTPLLAQLGAALRREPRASDSAACYAPHSHSTLSIGAVDDGESVFSRNGQRQKLVRGDVVLIPAGEGAFLQPADDGRWSYQMLYLDPAWIGGLSARWARSMRMVPTGCRPMSHRAACMSG